MHCQQRHKVDEECECKGGTDIADKRCSQEDKLKVNHHETNKVTERVREQGKGVGVESAELSVELQASWPRIEPVKIVMYGMDQAWLEPMC